MAILANWLNEEKTGGVFLNDDGTIQMIWRDTPSHTWSPPGPKFPLMNAIDEFEDMLALAKEQYAK